MLEANLQVGGNSTVMETKCILFFNAFYYQYNSISSVAFSSHLVHWVPGLSSAASTPEYSIPLWEKKPHGVKMSIVKVWKKGHQSCSVSAWLRVWFPISKWCSWSRGWLPWHWVLSMLHCGLLVLTSHVRISILLKQLAFNWRCPGSVSNFKSTILIETSLFWRKLGLWIFPLARAMVSWSFR